METQTKKLGNMYILPEILMTGKLPANWSEESLIADGLSGWACCMAGAEPPKKFGEGMALIASKVGASTPDSLSELADKILAKRQTKQP